MHSLTLLDIIVLLFVAGGGLLGTIRGFVTEVLSLFAWVAVVIALKLFFTPLSLLLGGWLRTPAGAALLAFVLIGVAVFFGGRMVAREIGRRSRTSVLGPVDRTLGLGFGALKGLIGATLLFMAGNLVYDIVYGGQAPRPQWVRDARSISLLQASRHAIDEVIARRRAERAAARGNAAAAARDRDAG